MRRKVSLMNDDGSIYATAEVSDEGTVTFRIPESAPPARWACSTQERTTETRLRAIHWTIWYFGVTQLAINTLLVYLILSR